MNFWVYKIDWRSRAVEIIGYAVNTTKADELITAYFKAIPQTQLDEFQAYHTVDYTPVSPQMNMANEQFNRLGGKAMAS
jgi:hypothetical protein